MKKSEKKFKYGVPISPEEMPRSRKRLPEYDECLREFLASDQSFWKVNTEALPSKKMRVILSSLKWRTKHKDEFKGINVVMFKNQIYLQKADQ